MSAAAMMNDTRSRSDTPIHPYQTSHLAANFYQTPPIYSSMFYPFGAKHGSPSPPNEQTLRGLIQPKTLEYHSKQTMAPQTPAELNSYLLRAVAYQQKMAAESHQIGSRFDSDESNECLSNPSTFNLNGTMTSDLPASAYPLVMGRDGKLARPFKAYPRNPLSLSTALGTVDAMVDRESAEKFQSFRKEMLKQIHAANGGQPTVSNPKMRRTNNKFTDAAAELAAEQNAAQQEQQNNQSDSSSNGTANGSGITKDSAYFERRKKNNAAAKKSRDRRRIKEDEIAIRAAYLERENIQLQAEVKMLKEELSKYM